MLYCSYPVDMREPLDRLEAAAETGIDLGLLGLQILAGRGLSWRHRRAGIVAVASDIDQDGLQ